VTEHKEFGAWIESSYKDVMMKRFKGGQGEGLVSKTFTHPVTFINDSTVLEIKKNGEVVLLSGEFERTTLEVDTVVLANVVVDESLYESYRSAGLLVTRIGDAKKVRNLRGAVTDGANVGLTLDKDLQYNANLEFVSTLPTELRR